MEQLGSVLVFMNLVSVNMDFIYVFVAMLVFGIILGSVGSMVSLNVYLKERTKKQ